MIPAAPANSFKGDCRAVTAVEYGLIAALVVAIGLSAMNVIGLTLNQDVGRIAGVLG